MATEIIRLGLVPSASLKTSGGVNYFLRINFPADLKQQRTRKFSVSPSALTLDRKKFNYLRYVVFPPFLLEVMSRAAVQRLNGTGNIPVAHSVFIKQK